jgi:hypothetical protein
VDEAERRRVESEFVERMQEEIGRVPVSEHLMAFMTSLSSMAFLRMGLSPDREKDRDLDQSRLAIDSFKALVDVLAPVSPAETVGLYRSTLAQMQMAYVSALSLAEKSEVATDS